MNKTEQVMKELREAGLPVDFTAVEVDSVNVAELDMYNMVTRMVGMSVPICTAYGTVHIIAEFSVVTPLHHNVPAPHTVFSGFGEAVPMDPRYEGDLPFYTEYRTIGEMIATGGAFNEPWLDVLARVVTSWEKFINSDTASAENPMAGL